MTKFIVIGLVFLYNIKENNLLLIKTMKKGRKTDEKNSKNFLCICINAFNYFFIFLNFINIMYHTKVYIICLQSIQEIFECGYDFIHFSCSNRSYTHLVLLPSGSCKALSDNNKFANGLLPKGSIRLTGLLLEYTNKFNSLNPFI